MTSGLLLQLHPTFLISRCILFSLIRSLLNCQATHYKTLSSGHLLLFHKSEGTLLLLIFSTLFVITFAVIKPQDWSDIEFGITEGVDFIALSFVKDVAAVKHLKDHLLTKNKFVKVLAKIKCLESLKIIEDIVEASDGIMVARGDLGFKIPLEHVPAIQEEILRLLMFPRRLDIMLMR